MFSTSQIIQTPSSLAPSHLELELHCSLSTRSSIRRPNNGSNVRVHSRINLSSLKVAGESLPQDSWVWPAQAALHLSDN